MPEIRAKASNQTATAHAGVSPDALLKKPNVPSPPGERRVLAHHQTVTSTGTTPSALVQSARDGTPPATVDVHHGGAATKGNSTQGLTQNSAHVAQRQGRAGQAAASGTINFGSASGSVSTKLLMWGAGLALVWAFFIRRK